MSNPYFDPAYNPYPPSVLIGTGIFFIILSLTSVGLRFYSRFLSSAHLGIDDWMTLPSLFICIIMSITQIIGMHST